jgi:hypothetical protein
LFVQFSYVRGKKSVNQFEFDLISISMNLGVLTFFISLCLVFAATDFKIDYFSCSPSENVTVDCTFNGRFANAIFDFITPQDKMIVILIFFIIFRSIGISANSFTDHNQILSAD